MTGGPNGYPAVDLRAVTAAPAAVYSAIRSIIPTVKNLENVFAIILCVFSGIFNGTETVTGAGFIGVHSM